MKKILFVFLSVISINSFAQEVKCPAIKDNNQLQQVILFDGKPEELASLVPDEESKKYYSWKLVPSERKYYLVCKYSNNVKIETQLTSPTKECRHMNKSNQVICK